jgi:leucyl-tRNA synthetase
MEYNFKEIESNWQAYWAKNKTFAATDGGEKPKYYVLDMFPYPSGAGLHVGHPLGYIASDIVARYKRHKGFNVLHPMGYDSFGLPAEQYAIQTGQHPKITTEQNIARYREQLDKIGFSFDWDREVRTSNPEYYKWTQWIFIQIFNSWYNKKTNKAEHINSLIHYFETKGFNCTLDDTLTGDIEKEIDPFTADEWNSFDEKKKSDILMNFRLAYLGESFVNWCPKLGTVLANDEVKDGVSERGGFPVERKLMKQWNMRITAYAQRLLDGLDSLDWTDSLKEAQKNWIGRSEGTSLKFKVQPIDSAQGNKWIEVFTTRPDTVFGVSFVTIAPEHELVETLTTQENKKAVDDYVIQAKNRSERERQAEVTKISGVFTGSYVIHPFTGKQIPIWIGDYVLVGYGTGAVMAVPAHDSRDFNFAKHFGLPILEVVQSPSPLERAGDEVYDAKEGKLINSDFLNGLEVKEAMKKIISEIEKKELGKGKVNYRLRDAVFGRQRYWGEPIPVYYKNDIPYVLNENELPLVLPEIDKYLPTEDGEPPLARSKDWRYKPHSNSPQEGEDAKLNNWQTAGNSLYNFTKEKSQELRKNQTEAEQALWEAIRKKALDVNVRRQHIIGANIVDFVSIDHKLVIEVDGKIHLGQKEYDAERTKQLESIGFNVIRFTNEEILHDIDTVVSKIKLKLEELPKVLSSGEDLGGTSYPYEHSTMPGWAGSSWYFLRYMDAKNNEQFVSKELSDYWGNVDLYIGGSEHATGHLLYVRFWTKFLKDLGFINTEEPAKKLINQGMIQGRSNFVYKLNSTWSAKNLSDDEIEEIEGVISKLPEVFISKNFYSTILKYNQSSNYNSIAPDKALESEFNFIRELIEQKNAELNNKAKSIINKNYFFNLSTSNPIAFNVDINVVNNDILDIDLFRNSRPYYNNAEFILEDGKYVCGVEIEKMSKSKFNVQTPDEICEKYGADTLRLYEMFLGPLEQSKPWNTNGITGVHGFLKKLWRLFYSSFEGSAQRTGDVAAFNVSNNEPTKTELKALHKTIKKITEDIERFSFNTSISNFMICVNELTDLKCNKRAILEPLLICLSPYAPHITEELWKQLGNTNSISTASFPIFNEAYLVDDNVNYPVSFNGKMKFTLELAASLTPQEVEAIVRTNEQTLKFLDGKEPKKVIVVHKKIVNMVI